MYEMIWISKNLFHYIISFAYYVKVKSIYSDIVSIASLIRSPTFR